MKLVEVVLLSLLVLFSTFGVVDVKVFVRGDDFLWNGNNIQWNDGNNWIDGVGPSSTNTLKSTSLRLFGDDEPAIKNEDPVLTVVNDGTFFVGSTLKLPSNGRMILDSKASNNILSLSFKSSSSGGTARYDAQSHSILNDFSCASNWLKITATTTEKPTHVPCSGDRVYFDSEQRFSPFSSSLQSIYVQSIVSGTFVFNQEDCHPSVNGTNPTIHLLSRMCDRIQINKAFCKSDDGSCSCYNACSSSEEANNSRDQDREEAENQEQELEREIVRTFEGNFSPSVLGVNISEVATLLEDPDRKEAFISNFIVQLAHAWGVSPDSVQVFDIYVTEDGLQLVVEGRITAKASSFLKPGQTIEDVANTTTLVFSIDENSGGKDLSQITSVVRTALASSLLNEVEAGIIAKMREEAGSCIPCIQLVNGFAAIAKNYRDATTVFLDVCPIDDSSAKACESNTAIFERATLTKAGQSLSNAALSLLQGNITTYVTDVQFQDGAVLSFLSTMLSLLIEQEKVDDARDNVLPRLVMLTSPSMAVGTTRPSLDMFWIVGETNLQLFQTHLSKALSGLYFLDFVPPQSIKVSIISRVIVAESRRRRALAKSIFENIKVPTNELGGTHLVITFDYETYCVRTALDTCSFSSSDAIYTDLLGRINSAIATYRISTPQCFTLASSWMADCLVNVAYLAIERKSVETNTMHILVEAGQKAVLGLIECGDLGRDANGDCFINFPLASHTATAIAEEAYKLLSAIASTTEDISSPNTFKSSSSTVIVAGIGSFGVLFIIIIVLVVILVRQRKLSRVTIKSEQITNRDIVAFENPMYTDRFDAEENDGYYAQPGQMSDSIYEEPTPITTGTAFLPDKILSMGYLILRNMTMLKNKEWDIWMYNSCANSLHLNNN
eukprot:m.58364 g.58364  ORF g.58364 m.58364 type:complete len:896 (-) comp7860_c0_seq4:80-2767(-)